MKRVRILQPALASSVCALALTVSCVHAEALSLADALSLTDTTSSVVGAAQALSASERRARADAFPVSLSVSTGYQFAAPGAQGQASWDALRLDATLQALPVGASAWAQQQRSLEVARAQRELKRARLSAQLEVARLYLDAYEAREALALERGNERLQTLKVKEARARAAAGAISPLDLKDAELDAASSSLKRLQQARRAQQTLLALRTLLYDADLTLSQAPLPALTNTSEEVLEARDLLTDARLELTAAEYAYAEAQQALWPKLSSSLSLNEGGAQLGLSLESSTLQPSAFIAYQPGAAGESGLTASVSLSIPLDMPTLARQHNAAAQLEAARESVMREHHQAQQDITSKREAVRQLSEACAEAQAHLGQAQAYAALQRQRFELGVATPAERLEAQQRVREAALEVTRAASQRLLGQLELRQALSLPLVFEER